MDAYCCYLTVGGSVLVRSAAPLGVGRIPGRQSFPSCRYFQVGSHPAAQATRESSRGRGNRESDRRGLPCLPMTGVCQIMAISSRLARLSLDPTLELGVRRTVCTERRSAPVWHAFTLNRVILMKTSSSSSGRRRHGQGAGPWSLGLGATIMGRPL